MAKRLQKITINGKTYLMNFGLGFLERLNAKYQLDAGNNFSLDFGIHRAMAELTNQNPLTVAYMIMFATADNHHKPTQEEVEDYLDEILDNEDEEVANKLFADFLDYLKKAPGAARIFKKAKEAQTKLDEATEEETTEEAKKK